MGRRGKAAAEKPKPVIEVEVLAPRGRGAVIAMLAVGFALWAALPLGPGGEHSRTPWWRWGVAVIASAIAVAAAGRWAKWMKVLRSAGECRRAVIAIMCAGVAAAYFLLTAVSQGRDFFPKTHDECSYAIQVRQLAVGRLWMPQHPLADFFDSFYLIVRPVYASMYFPGAAMLNVPGAWLHLPIWLIPLAIAAAVVGLTYRIVAELVDGPAGLLAVVLLASLSWFRMHSIMLMSQLPELMLGLVAVWAWLRYRGAARRGWAWLALIGVACGWAAITRPLDAICFAAPVGAAIAWETRAKPKELAVAAGFIAAGAAPFLAVQLVANVGITGHALRTPFDLYASENYPGTAYGFHAPAGDAEVKSVVAQKRVQYEQWVKPYIARHRPGQIVRDWWVWRLPLMADVTLPARPLMILLPVGLLGLVDRQRWVLFAVLPCFALLYVGYTFFLEHYALVVTPAVALLVVLAIDRLGAAWPRWRGRVVAGAVGAVVGFCLTGTWELNHWDQTHGVSDEPFASVLLRGLHDVSEPSTIVLFTFDPSEAGARKIQEEPVYNTDVAWPDDAPMIRAHDLGPRNEELFRYYAARQPERTVRRFDRRTGEVQELGRVKDLPER